MHQWERSVLGRLLFIDLFEVSTPSTPASFHSCSTLQCPLLIPTRPNARPPNPPTPFRPSSTFRRPPLPYQVRTHPPVPLFVSACRILPALNTFQRHSLILTRPTSPPAQSSPCQCATFNLTRGGYIVPYFIVLHCNVLAS